MWLLVKSQKFTQLLKENQITKGTRKFTLDLKLSNLNCIIADPCGCLLFTSDAADFWRVESLAAVPRCNNLSRSNACIHE